MLLLLLFALLFLNFSSGSVPLSWGEMWAAIGGSELGDATTAAHRFILLHHRLPQLVTAALAGAALGSGGLVMQTLFRNALADPSLLGINAGASLGAALVLMLMGGVVSAGTFVLSGFVASLLAAFVGAVAVLGLLLWAARRVEGTAALLIVGVMLSFVVGSVVSLLHFATAAEGLRAFLFWGMGDFSSLGLERLWWFVVALLPAMLGLFLLVKPLDALLLGTDYAQTLGVDVRRVRRWLLLAVGWLAAVVTAVCGPIAFLGLAAPHLARLYCRSSRHARLLPATLLIGANLALLCLWLSQSTPLGQLPINSLTPLIGAPIVVGGMVRKS